MKFIFKTSINSRIFFHWILIIGLISVILYHFSSNPYGLSIAIILLIITFFINPISLLILTENEIIIKRTYGFLFSKNEYFTIKNLNRIFYSNLRANVSGGGWIFTGNYKASVIFYVLSGSYFYQNTSQIIVSRQSALRRRLKRQPAAVCHNVRIPLRKAV